MRPIAFLVAVSAGMPVAPAAPATKDRPPTLYYPVTVGDRWVKVVAGDRGDVGTETSPNVVTAATTAGGVTTVAVASVRPDGQRFAACVVEVSAKGVCLIEDGGKKIDPPEWMLKLPAKRGDSWEVPVRPFRSTPYMETHTVAGEEEVVTPAGTFKAIRVDVGVTAGGGPRLSEWYAPGRGLVKVGTDRSALVLKSFTPGK